MTTFVNINQSVAISETGGTVLVPSQRAGQTFIVATADNTSDTGHGDFSFSSPPGPVLGVTGTRSIHSITILLRNISAFDHDVNLSIYEGTPPNDVSDLPSPIATSDDVTISSTSLTEYEFIFSSGGNLSSGNDYYASTNALTGELTVGIAFDTAYPDGSAFTYETDGSLLPNNVDATFRITLNEAGNSNGAGDPKITCLDGSSYHLPVDENNYCLFDTGNTEDRLIVNGKCHIRKNGKSYFRYIYINYQDEEVIVRIPNLKLIDRSDNFAELANKQLLPYSDEQSYKGQNIVQVLNNERERSFLIKTQKYGEIVVSCCKNKYKFAINGVVKEMLDENTKGCVLGVDNMCVIPTLDHVFN